tara:strand:- start:161 stop:478 length:318 start_codon:yes stop_codon:yes gene_type:complete
LEKNKKYINISNNFFSIYHYMNTAVPTAGPTGMSKVTNFFKNLSSPLTDATAGQKNQKQMMMVVAVLVLLFLFYYFVARPYMKKRKSENFAANSDSDSDDTDKEN